MVRIREELSEDINAIRLVNTQAFGRTQEADVIDKLRQNCSDLLSLVAVRRNEVVGHILFSPAIVESEDNYPRDGTRPDRRAARVPASGNRVRTDPSWHRPVEEWALSVCHSLGASPVLS